MKNETQQTVVREANYSPHHILCHVKWSLQGYESCTRHISLLVHYKHLFSHNIRYKSSVGGSYLNSIYSSIIVVFVHAKSTCFTLINNNTG